MLGTLTVAQLGSYLELYLRSNCLPLLFSPEAGETGGCLVDVMGCENTKHCQYGAL